MKPSCDYVEGNTDPSLGLSMDDSDYWYESGIMLKFLNTGLGGIEDNSTCVIPGTSLVEGA